MGTLEAVLIDLLLTIQEVEAQIRTIRRDFIVEHLREGPEEDGYIAGLQRRKKKVRK